MDDTPSFRPLKGISTFLYIWTHWDTISEEQKKRDERLQAVEEYANQMVRLKEQTHKEEKRKLERALEREREQWVALTSQGVVVIDQVLAKLDEVERRVADLQGHLNNVSNWLTFVLYVEDIPEFRDHVLSKLSAPMRELVSDNLTRIARIEEQRRSTPPVPPTLPQP